MGVISSWLVARRRLLMKPQTYNVVNIPLVYGQGLLRTYNTYSTDARRARSDEDIRVSAGNVLHITKPTNVNVAVGAWNADTKDNILYGGWDRDLTYAPTVDALVKIVIRYSDDRVVHTGDFDSLITATLNGKTFVLVN